MFKCVDILAEKRGLRLMDKDKVDITGDNFPAYENKLKRPSKTDKTLTPNLLLRTSTNLVREKCLLTKLPQFSSMVFVSILSYKTTEIPHADPIDLPPRGRFEKKV